MPTDHQELFKNENITIHLKRKPGCKIHLDVNVSPKATDAAYQKALKVVNKEISIPGFRKGKAPEAMIIKSFGKHIESEWREILLNTSIEEAIRLSHAYPFNQNSIQAASIKSISLQDGATLYFEYEAFPEVPVVNSNELSLPHIESKPVSDEDVNDSIEDLLLQSAEWLDVADRKAEEGDFVEIDIEALGDTPKSICKNARLSMSDNKMGAWLIRTLKEMHAGQTKDAMSEKDMTENCQECAQGTENHTHPEFIPTLCRITLNAIKQAKKPILDDEFAKKYGAENLHELKERIKVSLVNKANTQKTQEEHALLEQSLLDKYPFELPSTLIKKNLEDKKHDFTASLQAKGISNSDIETRWKKIEQEITQKIDHDFRLYFLIQKIASENQIEITQEEIMSELMRQMWLQRVGENSLDLSMDPKELQSHVKLQLLTSKSLGFLVDKIQASKKT